MSIHQERLENANCVDDGTLCELNHPRHFHLLDGRPRNNKEPSLSGPRELPNGSLVAYFAGHATAQGLYLAEVIVPLDSSRVPGRCIEVVSPHCRK
jgi:hypothetical protein